MPIKIYLMAKTQTTQSPKLIDRWRIVCARKPYDAACVRHILVVNPYRAIFSSQAVIEYERNRITRG